MKKQFSCFLFVYLLFLLPIAEVKAFSLTHDNRTDGSSYKLPYNLSKVVLDASRIIGIVPKELENKVNEKLKRKKPGHSRLMRDVLILYPYKKVLFHPADKILVLAIDNNVRITRVMVNNINIPIQTSDYVQIDSRVLKIENKISISFELKSDGKITTSKPIEETFYLFDMRGFELLNKAFEISQSFQDPLERNLFMLAIFTGLEMKLGEDFEFSYDLNKYRYEVDRELKKRGI